MKGIVFDIQSYSIYDGPGIRTAVYLKGCPLRCLWCHNPESQTRAIEMSTKNGKLEEIGKHMSADEVMNAILRDRPFFEHSNGGVTFTGGEPTVQKEFLLELLKRLKNQDIHTAIETCGYFSETIIDDLVKYTDLFLYDLKHIDAQTHKQTTGVDNKLILSNFEKILSRVGSKRIIVRIPLIPEVNSSFNVQASIQSFISECKFTGEVHLMPYHNMGVSKYEPIGRTATQYQPMTQEELEPFKQFGVLYGR